MIILSWNIRGVNDSFKIHEFRRITSEKGLDLCAILETRVRKENIDKINKKLGRKWTWVHNYAFFPKDRIWVGWDTVSVTINIDAISEHVVSVIVCDKEGSEQIIVTFVYGLHTIHDRKNIWLDLVSKISLRLNGIEMWAALGSKQSGSSCIMLKMISRLYIRQT